MVGVFLFLFLRRVFLLRPCSLFGHIEEEYIPDAESVYQHREQHHQPQACTLAQCFQLYTKEEQVMTRTLSKNKCYK